MDMRYLAFVQEQAAKDAAEVHAVRCSRCGLLVDPSRGYGQLAVAAAGNHRPVKTEEGYAEPAETPTGEGVCPGSEMLGRVE